MSQGYKFYAARAVEAKAEAAEATLENVRLRALRSEAIWLQLADHARKVEADREKARREKEAKPHGWPL
ncbi:hypothetical protein [Qipengyuania qiaonensis]|uniref:Uncharacterized protein n=1 Tax=Qipengyuania qiaonensis TaxID=2867240 RepID=A0ABS7J6J9_9SPHN|nr:hypothetical protein [Qipengyuania qiaonensis]MBX7482949.1 hypothetical protein [Qipengyuania qiaonensis]